jgi:hypothetical protein
MIGRSWSFRFVVVGVVDESITPSFTRTSVTLSSVRRHSVENHAIQNPSSDFKPKQSRHQRDQAGCVTY